MPRDPLPEHDAAREEAELLAPIAALTNYERLRPDKARWDLANMERLLMAGPALPQAGPARCLAIQVGGSKGKGTVVHMLESLGCAAGLRTVALTSPHLSTVRERIRIDGEPIQADGFRHAVGVVMQRAEAGGIPVSFFEVMIAAGVQAAADHKAELLLLEVGLGGRLDATTVVPVDGVVLTTIEREHTAILGDTIPAIAREKAGCIRPDKPVWTAAVGEALTVFRQRSEELSAPLQVVGMDPAQGGIHVEDLGWRAAAPPAGVPGNLAGLWGGRSGRVTWGGAPQEAGGQPDLRSTVLWRADGLSAVAVASVGLALAAWRDLVGPMPASAIAADGSLRLPAMPGRGELVRLSEGPAVMLDGAHTPVSCAALAADLRSRLPPGLPAGCRPHLIAGFHSDKDWRSCLRPFVDLVERATVVPLADGAGVATAELAEHFRELGIPTEEADDPVEVIQRGGDDWFLVTGSFHLVGEVRRRWAGL